MAQVKELAVELPHDALNGADWADGWQTRVGRPFANAREAGDEICRSFPVWTWPMMALRQIVVSPFGLKGRDKSQRDSIGFFPVVSETEGSIVAGFNDRHLDFRVIVDITPAGAQQLLSTKTVIRRHNLLGRIYLPCVLPFHRAIIKSSLRKVAAGRS